jgi:hypothetical protein
MDRNGSHPARRWLIALTIAGAVGACAVADPHQDPAAVLSSGVKQPPSGTSGVMIPPGNRGRTPVIVN